MAYRPSSPFVVARSDDAFEGPFTVVAETRSTTGAHPAAPARFTPVHLWSYVVLVSDSCGNVSAD
jgi:hypothetical protein